MYNDVYRVMGGSCTRLSMACQIESGLNLEMDPLSSGSVSDLVNIFFSLCLLLSDLFCLGVASG